MAHSKKSYYVTTPIYYVTAKPHLGSLYSTVLADVAARWHKIKGMDTFMLTGTDEHGQKIAQAAELVGKEPKAFVDSYIQDYKDTWHNYHIEYNGFIRTTDAHHVKAVQQWLKALIAKGDIYKGSYEGWYCTPCETYLTDKEVAAQQKIGNTVPACPSCGRKTEKISEESYFFKLSAYQDKLLKFYKDNPNFVIPKDRLNEVIRFVEGGLKDLSISRTTVKWGIPFPGDQQHVTYVWADALNNYITAIGYGQKGREKEFSQWWPADLHVMGKDIVRFHAIYWPAFLMASGLALPKKLLVHGWILMGDKKMSKSLGNVADPELLRKEYGADPVRYYLMRHMAITQDSSFSVQDLEQRIGSDLANDLGNLLNRMLLLAKKHDLVQVPENHTWTDAAEKLRDRCKQEVKHYIKAMDGCMYHIALGHLWRFINQVNAYFHANEPWKLGKKDVVTFNEIISAVCHSLYTVGVLVWPVMPEKMSLLLAAIGKQLDPSQDLVTQVIQGRWEQAFTLHDTAPLFKKPEIKKKVMIEEKPVEKTDYISIDDVVKVELIVGTVTECQEVPKSEKLLKMTVDFGDLGIRQILAGLKKHLTPDDLINKQRIFVFNLKPRKMMGMESQGMMLVAHNADGVPQPATVSGPVPNGTRLG